MAERHRVVIIGGGFGGLHAARQLRHADVDVTLIDKRNFHLFQPLLYQVATGALSPANIAAPLRAVFRNQPNVRVLLAEVTGFDVQERTVHFENGHLPYDTLIVAAGSDNAYFGHDEWRSLAPGLKTVEDATEIRRRILLAFEKAELETDPEEVKALMTFVVAGGGPTGVELSGALEEIANHSLRHNFRTIHPRDTRVILADAADRVLPPFPPELSEAAERSLKRLGVQVENGTMVVDVQPGYVVLKRNGTEERVPTHTVLWAAGVRACKLASALAAATGAQTDKHGRIVVEPDLTLAGHPEIFVIGDMAHAVNPKTGQPLPGVAQVAIQEGRYTAKTIRARLKGKTLPPFKYRNLGNLATIGRASAVADFGRIKIAGFTAWVLWLFVHLMHLVQFQNRVLVFFQWAWCYLTWNRAARLITGHDGIAKEAEEPVASSK
ncbi:MAG: NAD(P)/FAD-dependent oxidoreductase [Candidatus Hydrogenedentes bacterium]|nr:NAD(P)/FAD-dependent oxidoreductase [Candidatus Hydrogenedentota bacterium]